MGCDVMCAVCGGPTCGVQIAKQSPKARPPKAPKARPLTSRIQASEDSQGSEGSEEGEEESDEDERGYDPKIVNEADVAWTRSCHLLGFNARSTAIDKTYISGPGCRYEDYGCFNSIDEGNDPNFPEGSPNFQCYLIFDATQTICFPIHAPCLQLLTRVLCGNDNLDKDILYHSMSNLHFGLSECLNLDYGEPDNEFDQYWSSKSGAEILVVNPIPGATFAAFFRKTVFTVRFALPPPIVIDSRVRHDPFASLPYDVAHALLLLLPSHTVLALCTASYPIHSFFNPSNRPFWRAALRACMLWFWELHEHLRDGTVNPQTTDYKGLFLWAEKRTKPRTELRGPFMAIANRRRIWDVCVQLADDYAPRVAVKAKERAKGAAAEQIWETSVNPDMPTVQWPKLEDGVRTRTTSAQWICDVMSYERGGVFEVFWGRENSLIGMAFTDEAPQSVIKGFGITKGASKETIRLESGISGLVLHMPDIFVHEKIETSIKGITVLTTSDESYRLGDTSLQYCQRILGISPNHALTGIAGHITDEGLITRLGLVQHRLGSGGADDDELAPVLLHRPLWKAPAPSTSNALHNTTSPIWSHAPRLCALPSITRELDRYKLQCAYHEDIVPTDVFIWAADARELRSVRRISAYHPGGDRHIGALRVEFAAESGIAARVVGEEAGRHLLKKARFDPTWDGSVADGSWKPFEVDSAGGEVVVGVDAVYDEEIKSVRLRTNRGREVLWGEELRDSRDIQAMEPANGETIVGLAVAFIYPCYSEEYNNVDLSFVSALTMAL
ncbi:hypothetical protein C8R43DRAFT_171946 [Mycena crocata]|nr:hypothetical protein C8R43DRAFT_171946 [Mycena crocata]